MRTTSLIAAVATGLTAVSAALAQDALPASAEQFYQLLGVPQHVRRESLRVIVPYSAQPLAAELGLEPQIHRNIASTTSTAMIHSCRDGGPILASSPSLQVTISGLSLISGRQTT